MTNPRPAFTFLVCPDGHLLRTQLETMIAAHASASGPWERHTYWGDEEPPPRFWEQLTLQGLFGTPRILVARQAHLWPVAVWKKISRVLAHPAEQCWPFFCFEGPWEKKQPKIPAHIAKQPCMAFADSKGWIWRQDGLNASTLKAYVQKRAKERQLNFARDVLEQFCASVPPDALLIEQEMEKLSLLRDAAQKQDKTRPDAGRISLAMTATASWSPEYNVFSCIRAIEEGKLATVWKEMSRAQDDALFSLLALLAREVRQLWQLQNGENVRLLPYEASFKRNLAARLPAARLAEIMAELVDAELNVKSGRRTPEQSLEFLAVRLTTLFAPQARTKGPSR